MALRPIDWEVWKGVADWYRSTHPNSPPSRATRTARRVSFELRAAFAGGAARTFGHDRSLGALPCDRCGLWTFSGCATCSPPLAAICTECDAAESLCHACERAGR